METHNKAIIHAEAIAREFNLKIPIAREIVAEQTQKALQRSWLAWAIFLAGLGIAGWLFLSSTDYHTSAIWIVIGTVSLWHYVGRYQASQSIRKAAQEKSARINGSHS